MTHYVVIQGEQVDAYDVISKKNKLTLSPLTHHINNISLSIKFTMECKEIDRLPMLDTMIHRTDYGKLKVTTQSKYHIMEKTLIVRRLFFSCQR